jgi:glycosyltransferase involved in cell wall biosynthesis
MFKFSVITCTKNSAAYIAENIASVKKQTYSDYEHVFIDGYSTDGTADIIEKYQASGPDKVRFFQVEAKGISNAMNKGIECAQGEFLIHLHADDSFYDENVLADAAAFLEKNVELDWIYGLANSIEEDGTPVMVYPNKPLLHFHSSRSFIGRYALKVLRFVAHQAVFIRKSVFARFGNFDETLTSEMDPDLWLRIRKKTNWHYFNRIICNYRVRAGAQSSSQEKIVENLRNIEQVQKRYFNPLEFFFIKIVNIIRAKRNKAVR